MEKSTFQSQERLTLIERADFCHKMPSQVMPSAPELGASASSCRVRRTGVLFVMMIGVEVVDAANGLPRSSIGAYADDRIHRLLSCQVFRTDKDSTGLQVVEEKHQRIALQTKTFARLDHALSQHLCETLLARHKGSGGRASFEISSRLITKVAALAAADED